MNMSSNNTPLLTTHLFVSRKSSWDGFEEMLKRIDESGGYITSLQQILSQLVYSTAGSNGQIPSQKI